MHDTTWLLERAAERFEMPEPAMDRLVRRRDRRRRRRQLVTAGVALTISVLGVGVALFALRTRAPVTPASGGPQGPTGGDGLGSMVLPSLAIWAAIGALALVLLALGRLRDRAAGPIPSGTSPDGRGARASRIRETSPPPPAEAKARGRKEATMATHVERYPEQHTARNVWVTVGVLALLALAIGTGVLIGRATVEEPAAPLGLAPAATVQVVDANLAAMNDADREAFAATFAPEAVLTDVSLGDEWVGADAITAAVLPDLAYPGDWEIRTTTEVIQMGGLAANGYASAVAGNGISIWEVDAGGLITHQWVIHT